MNKIKERKRIFIIIAILILFSILDLLSANATIHMILDDEFVNRQEIAEYTQDQNIIEFTKEVDQFKDKLLLLKERDFIALFGESVAMPQKTFTLSISEPRGIGLPGRRYSDPLLNKDHTEFYMVNDFAGLKIFYSIDGESPVLILIYYNVDDDFSMENIDRRLAWDKSRFKKLVSWFERRRQEVFVWEVDEEIEKTFAEGDYERDIKKKLFEWKKSGKRLGYRLEEGEHFGDKYWKWFRSNGTLAREAYPFSQNIYPNVFIWYHPDGKTELRSERGSGKNYLGTWRWVRPESTDNIRYEVANQRSGHWRADEWTWYDKLGNKIRREWDDNSDGIPDWVSLNGMDEDKKRLTIQESWAINPEFILKESQISDQNNRRVPIRKIVNVKS